MWRLAISDHKRRLLISPVTKLFWFLLLPGLRTYPTQRLVVTSADLVDTTCLEQTLAAMRGYWVDIELAEPLVLHKVHLLPLKAATKANEVLRLKGEALEEQLGEQVVQVNKKLDRVGRDVRYTQSVMRRKDLERITEAAERAGVRLRQIHSLASDGDKLRFLDVRGRADLWIWGWWCSAFAVAVAGSLIWVWTLYSNFESSRDSLTRIEAQNVDLRVALDNAVDVVALQNAAISKSRSALALLEEDRWALTAIFELTQELPTNAWVHGLSLRDSQLMLSGGTTGNVQDLITVMQELDWVGYVNLERPVVSDRTRLKSNFELLIGLNLEVWK